jgi:hypothetical protein
MPNRTKLAHVRVLLLPAAAGLLAVATPTSAEACREVPMCVTIEASLEDAIFGTLMGHPWPARGMRVTVIRPYPEAPLSMYLDQEGCTSFESQFHAGFQFLIYPEAILGGSDNIRIKAYRIGENGTVNPDPEAPTTPDFVVAEPVTDANNEIALSIPYSDVWSVMAVATHVIHRVDTASGLGTSPLTGDHELLIVRTNYPNSRALNFFEAGENAPSHKFVVGHEIGHWMQAEVNEQLGGSRATSFDYDYFAQNSPCKFGVTGTESEMNALKSHGIRSAEYSSSAMNEGFGHYVGAVAFNEVDSHFGLFRYYKEIDLVKFPDYSDFAMDGSQVNLAGGDSTVLGGQSAWVETECDDDWAWPDEGIEGEEVTSEIDWLRFFWGLSTADEMTYGSAMPFWDVVHLLGFTHSGASGAYDWDTPGPLYCNVLGALTDNQSGLAGYEDRFVALTELNGVSYESPTACGL